MPPNDEFHVSVSPSLSSLHLPKSQKPCLNALTLTSYLGFPTFTTLTASGASMAAIIMMAVLFLGSATSLLRRVSRFCKPLPVFFTPSQVSKAMFESFDTDFVSQFPYVHNPDGVSGTNCSCPSSWRLRLGCLWCRLATSFEPGRRVLPVSFHPCVLRSPRLTTFIPLSFHGYMLSRDVWSSTRLTNLPSVLL